MRWRFTPIFTILCLLMLFAFPASSTYVEGSQGNKKSVKKSRSKKKSQSQLHATRGGRRTPDSNDGDEISPRTWDGKRSWSNVNRRPREQRMRRGRAWNGDVRSLPQVPMIRAERPEREGPEPAPMIAPTNASGEESNDSGSTTDSVAPGVNAPAPAPDSGFDGLDFSTWGNGHPPDTVGDVGPNHYIEGINTAVGIFNKQTGALIAAFNFNTLMSQGNFGNLCDTNNFGDPVILYDTFEDRWVITDFAFKVDASGNVVSPPGAFQCFAVSKTGDPVAGGWNFYSSQVTDFLNDYPKFGVWTDGIYMSANMFGFPAGGSFQGPRVWAFNKQQMYAGAPMVQIVSFDGPAAEFALLPSNARLQTGTPPAGRPNYFVSTWQFLNAVAVYKFHVDWDRISLSTFTGPDLALSPTSWPNASVANAPSQGGNALDVLQIRAMMQNQYTNLSGAESLWTTHTVRRATTTGFAAPRWYQTSVTGGGVAANVVQGTTWDPDNANVMHRFMPSLAVNRNGDMALGYSTSSSTTKPAIKYAGRLAADPINTFSQTEQVLIQGTGTQTGNCGGSACTRWGDYSAMSLDPDGCRFWYTNMYYKVDGLNHQTFIGSFKFPGCTPVISGALEGTVKDGSNNAPIGGVTVALGSRTTVTDGSGHYHFGDLPAGTYPTLTATLSGYVPAAASSIVVSEGGVATRDFTLSAANVSGCLVDTTQADFQAGISTACDLTGTPDSVTLLNAPTVDQQNLNVTTSGFAVNATSWAGQTFTAAVTGQLTRVELDLFCSGCTGTTPNLTVSIRNTSGDLPTGADLATATIAGFNSGAGGFFSASFSTPLTLTAGTRYAIVFRPVSNPSAGTYAYVVSTGSPYANGRRVTSANSGTTWAGQTTDIGFKTVMQTGFPSTGTFTSSLKDANPTNGASANWNTLSWAGSTPAGTAIKFQAAGSASPSGPFNFVGPDGTASTFFSNGSSLAQFNGMRYLKYRVTLTTSSSSATPTLEEVSVCFEDVAATTNLTVNPASGTFGTTVDLSATLATSGGALSGKSVQFSLNGTSVGSAPTNASGEAQLSSVSLAGIAGGTYANGITASFAGDNGYAAANGSAKLTVTQAGQTIDFGPLSGKTFGDSDFTVTATATSGLAVTFTAEGSCTVSGTTVHLTGGGTCTITASQSGDSNYAAAADVPQAFNVAKSGQTISFGALPDRTIGDAAFSVSATASSGLPVSFSAAGSCSVSGSTVSLTSVGNCSITASQAGNADFDAAASVTRSFKVGYAGCLLFDNSKANKAGSTIPIKLTLCSSKGENLSGAAVVVNASGLRQIANNVVAAVADSGNANPDNNFRFDATLAPGGGYIFNLSTKGLSTGVWELTYTATGDNTPHTLTFQLK